MAPARFPSSSLQQARPRLSGFHFVDTTLVPQAERKDAKLKNVIISEKRDRKAAAYVIECVYPTKLCAPNENGGLT